MTRDPRLPLQLSAVASFATAGLLVGRVAGFPWLPAPWDLGLATLALGAALTAGRAARHRPRLGPDEDPFAFLDGVQAVAPVPRRRRAWPVVRGILATVGALTVAGTLALALTPLGHRRLDRLLGATICDTRPARTREAGRLVIRHPLVHFEFPQHRRARGR